MMPMETASTSCAPRSNPKGLPPPISAELALGLLSDLYAAYNQVIKDSMMVGFSDNHSADELGYHYDSAIDSPSQHRRVFEEVRGYDGPSTSREI
jgi:hypothetical protein